MPGHKTHENNRRQDQNDNREEYHSDPFFFSPLGDIPPQHRSSCLLFKGEPPEKEIRPLKERWLKHTTGGQEIFGVRETVRGRTSPGGRVPVVAASQKGKIGIDADASMRQKAADRSKRRSCHQEIIDQDDPIGDSTGGESRLELKMRRSDHGAAFLSASAFLGSVTRSNNSGKRDRDSTERGKAYGQNVRDRKITENEPLLRGRNWEKKF